MADNWGEKRAITESGDALVTKMDRVINRDALAELEFLKTEAKVFKQTVIRLTRGKQRRVILTEDEPSRYRQRGTVAVPLS